MLKKHETGYARFFAENLKISYNPRFRFFKIKRHHCFPMKLDTSEPPSTSLNKLRVKMYRTFLIENQLKNILLLHCFSSRIHNLRVNLEKLILGRFDPQ